MPHFVMNTKQTVQKHSWKLLLEATGKHFRGHLKYTVYKLLQNHYRFVNQTTY